MTARDLETIWINPRSYDDQAREIANDNDGFYGPDLPVGAAIAQFIVENWLAVALGFLLGLGVTVGLASVVSEFIR